MLIAIFTAIFVLFGSLGLSGKSDALKEAVKDKERRKELLSISDQLSDEISLLQQEAGKHFRVLESVHKIYNSTAADFDAATQQLAADQEKRTEAILDAREAAKARMTEEEWNAVFKAQEQ